MSALLATNQQIVDSLRTQAHRHALRHRERHPLRAIDALIADLEEMHLAGRKRVPDTLDGRLAAVAAVVPEGHRAELRTRITIAHLMDRLYEAQEALLHQRGLLDVEDDDGSRPAPLSRAS